MTLPDVPHYVFAPPTKENCLSQDFLLHVKHWTWSVHRQWNMQTLLPLTSRKPTQRKVAQPSQSNWGTPSTPTDSFTSWIMDIRKLRWENVSCIIETVYHLSTQTARMFDIADVPFSAVSNNEKQSYISTNKVDGSIEGYILRGFTVRGSCVQSMWHERLIYANDLDSAYRR